MSGMPSVNGVSSAVVDQCSILVQQREKLLER